jgi:hypothetical protein
MQASKFTSSLHEAHDVDDANMFDLAPVSLWLEDVVKRADALMYKAKQNYYAQSGHSR